MVTAEVPERQSPPRCDNASLEDARSVPRRLCALRFIETFDDTISLQPGEPIDPKDPIEPISSAPTRRASAGACGGHAGLADFRVSHERERAPCPAGVRDKVVRQAGKVDASKNLANSPLF
jgi:hypothetical protein